MGKEELMEVILGEINFMIRAKVKKTVMTKIKISIKNRFTGSIIFEYEKENATIKDAVLAAIEKEADLSSADLSSANLSSANLSSANLSSANLRYADLSSADLRSANLRSANLRSIKTDFFYVLLQSLPEIKFLKQNIIEGKIDGSTYDGECACLSGTLVNGAKKTDGKQEKEVIKSIMDCRDSNRPIERFFLGIKSGDTPETNQVSKIVLEWLCEFETLMPNRVVAAHECDARDA